MNPWKELKDLPRNIWVLFFTTLINRIGSMVLPFLAIYLTQKEGISIAMSGLVLTIYGFGALITSPYIGKLSDKIGPLVILKLSLILSGVVFFIYPFVNSFTLILVTTFILSIICEAFRPANLAIISHLVESKQRRTAYVVSRLAINLGMSIGPVVGGLLVLINFSLIFYVDGITSILAGLFLIISPWENTEKVSVSEENKISIKKISPLKDKYFLYFLIALFPIPLIYMQIQASLPVYLVKGLHFPALVYGLIFTINTLLIIFIEVPLNSLLKKWPDNKMLSTGAILSAIGFGAIMIVGNLFSLIITIVIWTFGEMIFFPASSAYISELAPVHKRGEYMGFYQVTFYLAFTIGPWMGTAVLEQLGPRFLWGGAFILGSISGIMLLKIKNKNIN